MQEPEPQSGFYRSLVENSLGLMCIHDLDGILLAVNPAVVRSLGYQEAEGINRSLRDFLAPSVQSQFDAYLHRIRAQTSDSGLMHLVAKDGSERIWLYRNVRHDTPGQPSRVLGHALDITDRVQAERELKLAQRELKEAHSELARRVAERTAELEQANQRLRDEMEQRLRMEEELFRARNLESLGLMAGGIAHDFNNLLTVIQGNVELAKLMLAKQRPIDDLLEQSSKACKLAAGLASQLLVFAKGGVPVLRACSPRQVIGEAIAAARWDKVSPVLRIPDDLWTVEVDRAQMLQALQNILSHAREATPEGGVIEVDAGNVVEEPDDESSPIRCVRISIRDHGAGLKGDVLLRVFDPYFSAGRTGSGLHLATAQAIIARHGARIQVDSQPGQGSTFTVTLPASESQVTAELPVPTLETGSGRILVMDDEPALCLLLTRMLEPLGYEVTCVADGISAVEAYQRAQDEKRAFAAVLMDLTIRNGMGGIEAAALLRRVDPDARLVVSSGYSDAPAIADHARYGFNDSVAKPWTPAQVSEVLRRVIQTRTGGGPGPSAA